MVGVRAFLFMKKLPQRNLAERCGVFCILSDSRHEGVRTGIGCADGISDSACRPRSLFRPPQETGITAEKPAAAVSWIVRRCSGPRFQSGKLFDGLRLLVHKDYGPAVKIFHVLEIRGIAIARKLLLCLTEL